MSYSIFIWSRNPPSRPHSHYATLLIMGMGILLSVLISFISLNVAYASPSLQDNSAANDFSTMADSSLAEANIILTEIHHSPDDSATRSEFVEIFNAGRDSVNLKNWAIDDAVNYVFLENVVLRPGEYAVVAQEPAVIAQRWGILAHGPYQGRLAREGEEVVVRGPNAQAVDRVDYRLGFPWPTVGDAPDQSINLIDASLDNARPGYWRSSNPTPGGPNALTALDAPPLVENVRHSPSQPISGQPVQILATVEDPDGIVDVELHVQVVEPGAYIAIDDPLYQTEWTQFDMTSTGAANRLGSVYEAVLPESFQQHRRLIRYRITATDETGQSITVPFADDPQPNFAYFVYDGLPAWQGAIRPQRPGSVEGTPVTFNFEAMRPTAVYHLITTEDDYDDGLRSSGYEGSEYLWDGALVYGDQVYDHIRYRARGGVWRYALGKNHPKIDFNRGHEFQAHDDYGVAYNTTWRKLNLSAVIQQGDKLHRGEQGMFESTGFRLFNLAGVEAPLTHFVHFRTITQAGERPSGQDLEDQYLTDFQGLYLAIEQMDGRFLDEHLLPDGNLYKMEAGTGELNSQGSYAATDKSDLNGFTNGYYSQSPSEEWWLTTVDMNHYYSYRTIVEAIRHYDINKQKNYFYFNNPITNLWQVHPWDLDQTWADNMFGSGYSDLVQSGIVRRDSINIEYQNRLRELLDLLFNNDQGFLLLDEQASFINTPADGASMVDADRAMWDRNPIMESRSADPTKAGTARFYESSPTADFPGMVNLMKRWIVNRSRWMQDELLDDADLIPYTPVPAYVGEVGFPADELRFALGGISDPQGADTVVKIQWRIAPIHYPGVNGYSSAIRNRYEIEASWQSDELPLTNSEIVIPQGACVTGQTCRVRARVKDSSGFWSHWSAPVEFVASAPVQPVLDTLLLTEIMYEAGSQGPIPGEELDFVELKNVSNLSIDLAGTYFADGIEFIFPEGSVIEPRQFIVLTEDQERFEFIYGFSPFGQYKGKLSNSGETIQLNDAFGRAIFDITYDTDSPWPVLANGQGYSMVLSVPGSAAIELSDPMVWRVSANIGGSPGADDPVDVVINEVLANPLDGEVAAVELMNPTENSGAIGGWYLTTDVGRPRQYRIPSDTVIGSKSFWHVDANALGSATDDESGLRLKKSGGELYLLSADELGRLTGYRYDFSYAAATAGVSTGRVVNAMDGEDFVLQNEATIGLANSEPVLGPIIFSKLNYRPNVGSEFIEITNISSSEVVLADLQAPEMAWQIRDIYYQFPLGTSIPPNGRLLLVSTEPAEFCTSTAYQDIVASINSSRLTSTIGSLQVLGPYQGGLPDTAGFVSLSRPVLLSEGSRVVQSPIEKIDYSTNQPWPSIGFGDQDFLLERTSLGYGNDPAQWRKTTIPQSETLADTARQSELTVCSFDVVQNKDTGEININWSVLNEASVTGYQLWQFELGGSNIPNRLTDSPISVESISSESTTLVSQYKYAIPAGTDQQTSDGPPMIYWLEVLGANDETVASYYRSQRVAFEFVYLPVK